MQDPIASLRRQLRWTQAVLGLCVAALCLAATPATRPLILDVSNHPTTPVDFGSANWTGDPTSGKAINPASIGAGTPGTAKFGGVSIAANGSSNGSISFGSGQNSPALVLHDGGAPGTRSGIGFVDDRIMQFYVPNGKDFIWIDSGDFSVTGGVPTQQMVLQSGYGLSIANSLVVNGAFASDLGAIFSDGSGNLRVAGELTVGGTQINTGNPSNLNFTPSGSNNQLGIFSDGANLYFTDQNNNVYLITMSYYGSGG